MKKTLETMNIQTAVAITLLGFGYWLGTTNTPYAHAQANEKPQSHIGVSIPAQGAALVKGADGNAYVIGVNGVVIRAANRGKPLPLP